MRGFEAKQIHLNGNIFIVISYPADVTRIIKQIFDEQGHWIVENFKNLITENAKSIDIQRQTKEQERLAFRNPVTDLLNDNSLQRDLERDIHKEKSIVLIQVVEYEARVNKVL